MSKKQITTQTEDVITAAFTALSSQFFLPVERKTKDGFETVNALAFTQGSVLKGFCWTLEAQIGFTVASERTAANQLQSLVRGAQGEVSDRQIESKMEFMDRLELQRVTLQRMLEKAIAVYEQASGKGYIPREVELADRAKAKTVTAGKVADARASAADRLAKYGLSADGPADRHDGSQQPSDHSHRVAA